MARRTTLRSNTALVSTVPVNEDISETAALIRAAENTNEPNIPSDDDAKVSAEHAFAMKTDSETKESSAVQLMAYAVMCHYAHMILNDDKPPAMEQVNADGKSFGTLKTAMVEFFLDGKPNTDAMPEEDALKAQRKFTNRVRMLERGIRLAALLLVNGVTMDAFNTELGNFTIPSRLLLRDGEKALEELAGIEYVRLDNDTYGARIFNAAGVLRTSDIAASVARLHAAHAVKKARQARQTDQAKPGTTGNDTAPGETSGDSGPSVQKVETMIREVRAMLIQGRHDAPGLVTKDAFDDATWNALADIAQWVNAVTSSPNFINKGSPDSPVNKKPARKARAA
jgi:hypothetical protein